MGQSWREWEIRVVRYERRLMTQYSERLWKVNQLQIRQARAVDEHSMVLSELLSEGQGPSQ